jgi:hypothetical protein
MKASFKRLVGQCNPLSNQPITAREIDLIKSAEYAKGAKREREEILRMIWDAVESATCSSQEAMAKAIFYRVEDRK